MGLSTHIHTQGSGCRADYVGLRRSRGNGGSDRGLNTRHLGECVTFATQSELSSTAYRALVLGSGQAVSHTKTLSSCLTIAERW